MADMIRIKSLSDSMISIYDPTIPINKLLEKRGAIVVVEKEKLIQLFFNSGLETLLRSGMISIEDNNFLYEVGFLTDPKEKVNAIELTPALMKRCISAMPLHELKIYLAKFSSFQLEELAEFAVANHNDLKMDRIDLLTKFSGKNILKAIELHKQDQEG